MNQKEWKKLSIQKRESLPKDFFLYRNLAVKILGWKRGKGLVIHHLRDTEEQRKFNDTYYERWGIDFNGQLKYVKLVTKEEHTQIHKLSEETKAKIRKNTKRKPKLSAKIRILHKKQSDTNYKLQNKDKIKQHLKEYYLKHKDKIKSQVKEYRENNKDKIRKAKQEWKAKNREYVNKKKREYYRKTHPTH